MPLCEFYDTLGGLKYFPETSWGVLTSSILYARTPWAHTPMSSSRLEIIVLVCVYSKSEVAGTIAPTTFRICIRCTRLKIILRYLGFFNRQYSLYYSGHIYQRSLNTSNFVVSFPDSFRNHLFLWGGRDSLWKKSIFLKINIFKKKKVDRLKRGHETTDSDYSITIYSHF